MKNIRFLFLTNIKGISSSLVKVANRYAGNFDFIIHSTETVNTHYFDLRNSAEIIRRIDHETTIILYLEGYFSIYIVDRLLSKLRKSGQKLVVIYSAANLLYSHNNLNRKITKQILQMITNYTENYLLISVMMTEYNYLKHFQKPDEKYFPLTNIIKTLVVPDEIMLVNSIELSISENRKSSVYLLNQNHELALNEIRSKWISPLNKILSCRIFGESNSPSIWEEFSALKKLASQLDSILANYKIVTV